jgi:hypothetical protein
VDVTAEGAAAREERNWLWLLGTVVVALSVARLVIDLLTGSRLLQDHPSGAWAALSDDLLHGVLYRPVESELGWGGTRYPPFYFALRALLARGGLGLIGAGALLDAGALAALVLVMHGVLRELGVERWLARGAAMVGIAVVPAQLLLGLGKADLVATALSLGGVLLALRRRPVSAAALFGLAVLTKWTVVFGWVASMHDALAQGRRRAAARLLLVTLAWVGAGVALASWASDGRLLAQLRACATGGGLRLVEGPIDFLIGPFGADEALILLAFAALAVARLRSGLPLKLLGWTLVGTIAVFLSPGIAENHFLDLDFAAWIALTACIGSPAVPRRFGTLVLASLAVLSLVRIAPFAIDGPRNVRIEAVRPALGEPRAGPLLSENPWVPLQLGERPVLLDAFTFRILARRDPELMRRLGDDLARRRFRAVVLRRSPVYGAGRSWYSDMHFGPGFVEALEANYQRTAVFPAIPGGEWTLDVWRPRSASP